ncbi:MAG TPA: MFS transporter [Thermoanaerobaculia bacterium]
MTAVARLTLRQNLAALPRPTWILFAGTFINRFGTFVMPFLVIYLTRQGYSVAQAGFAVSAYGGGHLFASMLGGHLADAIGRRHTIALSMFASSISTLALSQARGLPAILGIAFCVGLSAELYRPAASALIADLVTPEQRVTAFGVYRLAINLGFAFGPATAGFVADHSFHWLFIGDAVTSALYGLVALFFLPHGQRGQTQHESMLEGVRVAIKDRPFVLFLMATLAVTWIEFQTHSTFPIYIQDQGFSTSTYGLLLSINGIMIVLFELGITNWTQRFQARTMIATGYALTGIGFALTGFAHSIPALALTVVVWTLGEMIYAPVTGAYVANIAPERYRGRYNGLWVMMWSIGMLLGPSLGTAIYGASPAMLFVSAAALGLVAAALALRN